MNNTDQPRVAVLVSSPVADELRDRISNGLAPRHDMLALADALNATLVTPEVDSWGKTGKFSRFTRLFSVAWRGFTLRDQYDMIISDLDHTGGVLAILFKLTRTRRGHIVICHGKLSRSFGAWMVRIFRLYTHIDRFLCYGAVVEERLKKWARVPEDQVKLVLHPADHHFWRPSIREPERLISSAGMYRRDYPTLVQAVRDMDVRVEIAAFSPWVKPGIRPPDVDLPGNVYFTRLPPTLLRDLYARSLFVVVPVHETASQAGSLVIYEAMSMGKAVVATGTEGQQGMSLIRDGKTGFYVKPGDVESWRKVISYLLENPQEAILMGQAARAEVEHRLNLDQYISDMAGVVRSISAARGWRQAVSPVEAVE